MKVAGKITPRIRARIVALYDSGKGYKAIASTLAAEMDDPPARSTIQSVLKGHERPDGAPSLPPDGPETPRPVPRRPRASHDDPDELPDGPEDDDEDDDRREVRVPVLPADASPSAVAIWQRMRAVGAKITALEGDVSAGRYPATQWAALIKVETQLASELADHIPPPPPDPAKDPTNIAARSMVHSQIVQSIDAAAARVGRICFRCGKESGR